jgi:hypothetical protein
MPSKMSATMVLRGFFLAFLWLAVALGVAWGILPTPKKCLSLSCGSQFKSNGAPVFGHGQFTWPQTILMLVGMVGAVIIMVAVPLRQKRRSTSSHDGSDAP